MTKRRSYGDGGIDQRGENTFRLRYRIGKQRYSVTFHWQHLQINPRLVGSKLWVQITLCSS
jgi:hypothetical protein